MKIVWGLIILFSLFPETLLFRSKSRRSPKDLLDYWNQCMNILLIVIINNFLHCARVNILFSCYTNVWLVTIMWLTLITCNLTIMSTWVLESQLLRVLYHKTILSLLRHCTKKIISLFLFLVTKNEMTKIR